jgi:hypothetical protein
MTKKEAGVTRALIYKVSGRSKVIENYPGFLDPGESRGGE